MELAAEMAFPMEDSVRRIEVILGSFWHGNVRVVGLGFCMWMSAGDIEILNGGTGKVKGFGSDENGCKRIRNT
jgi:hypothetical protein